MNNQQEDIIKGVFFGQAIGDALGLGTEFLTRDEIKTHYPSGLFTYSQIIQDKHRKRWEAGDWTDDTDQFLCIVDAILNSEYIDERIFASELFKWYKGSPMGIGSTVLKVVSLPQFTLFPHKGAELVWKLSKFNNASNGAIMRTSVLGTWQFWDLLKVIANTENVCKVTHFDPRCIGSCVIVSSIISTLLRENRLLKLDELIKLAENYDPRIKDYVLLGKTSEISNLNLSASDSMGYTLKTLSAALWAYFNAKDFEDGLIQIVNEGGDSDTNAAVACSILGAKFGYGQIPQFYIENLLKKDLLNHKFGSFILKSKKCYLQSL